MPPAGYFTCHKSGRYDYLQKRGQRAEFSANKSWAGTVSEQRSKF